MANGTRKPAKSAKELLQIRHDDPRDVHVCPPAHEHEQFSLRAPIAVVGCQIADKLVSLMNGAQENFEQLRKLVVVWAQSHASVVRVVSGTRGLLDGMVLVFVTEGSERDYELDDAIGELDDNLKEQFEEMPFTFHSVPSDRARDLAAYLDTKTMVEVYARAGRAQG